MNGLAVDWVNDILYWTDAVRRIIEVSDYQGRHRYTLLNSYLSEPRSIMVEPLSGYVLQCIREISI